MSLVEIIAVIVAILAIIITINYKDNTFLWTFFLSPLDFILFLLKLKNRNRK